MNYFKLYSWIEKKLKSKKRLANVAIVYVLFLMVPFRKHSLEAAASFSNTGKSRFSKFLKNNSDLAAFKLDELSKRQARQFGRKHQLHGRGQAAVENRNSDRRHYPEPFEPSLRKTPSASITARDT